MISLGTLSVTTAPTDNNTVDYLIVGGGGGSGYIHPSVIRGLTLTGVREYPPMFSDPDAIQYSIGTGFRIGTGGDEASTGGYGLIVIYY